MKEQFKPYKTVEQIAKKHRMEVSFIQRQLDMGEPIEHEHTKDHKLAREIALQHLDEIPDYYTRLKKMEADAKKHHKQFKDVPVNEDLRKWFGAGGEGGVGGGGWDRYNTKGERIGKCAREPGEPKPKCLSKEKAAKMSKDEIAASVRRKRKSDPVADRPGKGGKPIMVSNKIKEETQMKEKRFCQLCGKKEYRMECSYGPEMWDKFSIATVHPMHEAKAKDHEHSMARSELATVSDAVKRLKAKLKGEGNIEAWVQSKITKAADYLDSAADYMDSGEHDIEEAKGPCWTGYKQVGMKKKGSKMVPNCVPEHTGMVAKILEQYEGEKELQALEEKNVPTNPSLWSKMKSRAKAKFDVYPSAYANGWASKEYKKAGGGWKSVSEELEEAVRIPAKTGNIISVVLTWRGKYYAIKMFFPQVTKPNRKEVQDQINKVYPGSKVHSYQISDYQPGDAFLQTEEVIDEDWQKVNRQDKTDGLSQKAVNAYRQENPGSKLKTAVTEKNPSGKRAERRKSFCRRMSGMKKRLTSAETARDPDSRINKALRRWNCN
jgi:hypothetical protein